MPLIIESYENPYSKIANLLFPEQTFTYLNTPISEGSSELFCYTRKELNPDEIMYYFNKIYYIEKGKIIAIDKAAQKIKYYDLETGKLIRFEESVEAVVSVDNSSILPHFVAQTGELVIFPENEEDDD